MVGAGLLLIIVGIALFPFHHDVMGSLVMLVGGLLILGTWLAGPGLPSELPSDED